MKHVELTYTFTTTIHGQPRIAWGSIVLDHLEYELQHKQRTKSHESLYAKYFTVNETPVKGVVVTPNQEAINQAQQNFGYFSLLSNGEKNPIEVLGIYRNKDVIEKAFANLKERLNMRRLNVSSEESLDGKLFVQFIALIYLSSIKKVMNDHDLFKTFTLQELLDELDIIEQHQQPRRQASVGELTKKQLGLYELFKINPLT